MFFFSFNLHVLFFQMTTKLLEYNMYVVVCTQLLNRDSIYLIFHCFHFGLFLGPRSWHFLGVPVRDVY